MYSFSAGALKGQRSINFFLFFRVYSFTFLSSPSSCFLILCFWIQIVYELGNEKIKESNDNDDDDGGCVWLVRGWEKWYKRRISYCTYIKNGNGRWKKRKGKSFYFYVNVFHCLWTMSLCMLSLFFLPILRVYAEVDMYMPMDMWILPQVSSKSERTSFLCNLFYSFLYFLLVFVNAVPDVRTFKAFKLTVCSLKRFASWI